MPDKIITIKLNDGESLGISLTGLQITTVKPTGKVFQKGVEIGSSIVMINGHTIRENTIHSSLKTAIKTGRVILRLREKKPVERRRKRRRLSRQPQSQNADEKEDLFTPRTRKYLKTLKSIELDTLMKTMANNRNIRAQAGAAPRKQTKKKSYQLDTQESKIYVIIHYRNYSNN